MDTTLPIHDAPPPALTAPALRVVALAGEVRFDPPALIPQGGLIIGREGSGPLSLPEDGRLSRRHARIRRTAGGLGARVEDLGSRNGTLLNGAPVTAAPLHDGDVLRAGDSFFVFRAEPLGAPEPHGGAFVGLSPAARRVRREIALLGPAGATVLLQGETGTGKEVVARALHAASGRGGSFIPVNCGAIPESLAESALFGHRAGAFTGAAGPHPGLFAQAKGGTLFLDEVADLPAAVQPKLLRVLESREVTPLGAAEATPVDARVIAASDLDLGEAAQGGRFRASLLARLAEITLRIPPLRERREDVLPILLTSLGEGARLSPDLTEALLLHPWPGNARELLKVGVELRIRGPATGPFELAPVAHRLTRGGGDAPSPRPPEAPVEAPLAQGLPDRVEVTRLYDRCEGNVSRMAREAGRSRRQVRRWLDAHGLGPQGGGGG